MTPLQQAQRGSSGLLGSSSRSTSTSLPVPTPRRRQQPPRARRAPVAPRAFMEGAHKAPASPAPAQQQLQQQQPVEQEDLMAQAYGFVLRFFSPQEEEQRDGDDEGLPEWATEDAGGHGGGWVHSHIAERLATESALDA